MNSLKRFLFSAISIALIISGLLFSVSSFPEKAFAADTGILISQVSTPSVTLASSTIKDTSGRVRLSGVTVSDTTGNPLTVTIVFSGPAKFSSASWKATTQNFVTKNVTSGTLAQVNSAIKNSVVFLDGSSVVATITVNNGQATSTPVSLTLQS